MLKDPTSLSVMAASNFILQLCPQTGYVYSM